MELKLCILLEQFACPIRYSDMIPRFGRLYHSTVSLQIISWIIFLKGMIIVSQALINHSSPVSLTSYVTVIYQAGAPLENCWGFAKGTVRPVCRPGKQQRILYNGHKRVHSIKFQSVVIPNGLIANLSGPYEGKKNMTVVCSENLACLQVFKIATSPLKEMQCALMVTLHTLRLHLQAPFRATIRLTEESTEFNRAMNAVRVSVE